MMVFARTCDGGKTIAPKGWLAVVHETAPSEACPNTTRGRITVGAGVDNGVSRASGGEKKAILLHSVTIA